MNPLRTLENMIAGLVEGTFGRVFKAEVRPMELAHKLAREMDENKTVSVSRVYAPNEYSVWLSPRDRARYEGVEHEVIEELCAYLLEHARGEDLALSGTPSIVFHTDERLQLGEFGIEARTTSSQGEPREQERELSASRSPSRAAAPLPPDPEPAGNTMIFSNSRRVREAIEQAAPPRRRSKALLVFGGRRMLLAPTGAIVGRSRDCDVVLDDAGVSRRHAELRSEGATWTVQDLGSTNGVRVNGLKVHGAHELHSGDRLELGSTEMLFEVVP